ncbi:S8 family peptidase [Fodinibius halophilus]|uniref:S8/S53 family peptidase n=1 Tax=Fodinibius halophilus TaxID=1736908 RepID=A0A6M1TFD5_9BACT|nr:S8/S53 family peptidase [Fodinibius halophilus]NGP89504.1 S8/S53 family peptidase [Fodinibius halophilus]
MSGTKIRDITRVLKTDEEIPIRTGVPKREGDENKKGILYPGFEIKVVEEWKGEEVNGNDLWYGDKNGDFYWSGWFEEREEKDLEFKAVDHAWDWWQTKYSIDQIWDQYNIRGEQVTIGILDSGIWKGNVFENCDIKERNYITDNGNISDDTGHGTQVASILAAYSNQMIGIIPKAKFIICKTVNRDQKDPAVFEKALKELKDEGADFVVMSYSFYRNKLPDTFEQTINSLDKTLLICSVGNLKIRHRTSNKYPASFDSTIAVGGANKKNKVHSESSKSDHIDVLAPSEDIKTVLPSNSQELFKAQGTSFATPIVAGVLGLMLSYCRSKGEEIEKTKLKEILRSTADKPAQADPTLYGHGIINPLKAMEQLNNYLS